MSSSPKASLDTARLHAVTDLRDDMASFTMPTLIVHGDADALVPIEVSASRAAPDHRRLHARRLRARLAFRPFITHRERLNEQLVAFVRPPIGRDGTEIVP